jgi:cytochrome c2
MSTSDSKPFIFWLSWHLLAVLVLVLVGPALLELRRLDFDVLIAFCLAYLAGALLVPVAVRAIGNRQAAAAVLTAGALAGLACLWLLVDASKSSRLIAVCYLVAAALLSVPFLLPKARWLLLAVLGLATVGLVVKAPRPGALISSVLSGEVTRKIENTAFYNVRLDFFRDLFPEVYPRGGGITRLGDGYLVASADGGLFQVAGNNSKAPDVSRLPLSIPLNIDAFRAGAGDDADESRFRVADILASERDEHLTLYASHHWWQVDDACLVLRVSAISGPREVVLAEQDASAWETLFESRPCIELRVDAEDSRTDIPKQFSGHETGGRMAILPGQGLLLTLGDLRFDGRNADKIFAQDQQASFGKTVLIDPVGGGSRIFTSGHRNPQGLVVTVEGTAWSTEHGPEGGDELNRLVDGANYGWPFVTYGTDYGASHWPLSHSQGEHEGYEKPVYAWVPSIGISNLIQINGGPFSMWQGDFLVASLKGQSLYRVRVRDGRAVFAEPIWIGERIRDLEQGADGRIMLWTDEETLISVGLAEVGEGGRAAFAACAGCHVIIDGHSHGIGPDLHRVVGRDIAGAPGYQYSKALLAAGGRWTEERLDAYLANPQAFAPGTTMGGVPGVDDPDVRKAIINYLKSR